MVIAVFVFAVIQARADTTWTNVSGSGLWSQGANWSNGVPDVLDETLLPEPIPGGDGSISLSGLNATTRALSLDAAGYTLSGGNLTLGDGLIATNGGVSNIHSELRGLSGLTKHGLGILNLNGSNTYEGATDILGGTLTIGPVGNTVPDQSTVTVATGATLALDGNVEDIGALAGGGQVTLGPGGSLGLGFNHASTTYAGVISGSGSISDFGLVKFGAGVQTLTGANTYSGGTRIVAGMLEIVEDANLGVADSTLVFAGGELRVTNSTDVTFARPIVTVNAGAVIDTQVTGGSALTVPGGISGNGGLAKDGPGTMILSDTASTYDSLTIVQSGKLLTAQSELLPDTTGLVINGGSYNMSSGVTETIDSVQGVGQITFESGPGNHLIVGSNNGSAVFEGDIVPVGSGNGKLTKIGTGTQLFAGSVNVSEMAIDAGRVFFLGGLLTTGVLEVAPTMTAQMIIRDATTVTVGDTVVGSAGNSNGANGTLIVDGIGTTLTATNEILVGFQSTGQGRLTVRNGGRVDAGGVNVASGSVVELLGSEINTGSFTVSPMATMRHEDGTLTVNGGIFDPGTVGHTIDGADPVDRPVVNLVNGASASLSGVLFVGSNFSGELRIQNGSSVDVGGGAVVGDSAGSHGKVVVDGAASTLTSNLNIDIGRGGIGDVVLKGGGVAGATDTVSIFANGRLAGDGQVNANLVRNEGIGASRGIEPGDVGESGQLTIDGRYRQEPQGVLRVDIAGTGGAGTFDGNDMLAVTGEADLDGVLELDLIQSFTPAYGDGFTMLTYGSRTGAFDQISLNGSTLALQPNLALAPVYDFPGSADPRFAASVFAAAPHSLTLFTTLPGDLNLDLSVGDEDLSMLLDSFGVTGTTWISGDVTGDGETGDEDLNLLLSNFGTSVVLNGNASVLRNHTAVPEPGMLLVLYLGCLLLGRRRGR